MSAILTRGLRRFFKNREVLRGVDLEVDLGSVAALLGPNGSGKTTLIRILTTELMPHGGEAYILGFDVVKQASEVRRRIAVMPQDSKPIPFLTPREFIRGYLLLRGMSINDAEYACRKALDVLMLWNVRNTPIYRLSGGLARRTLLAAVLASNADVVFLDEPTVGLDVASRRIVWDVLRKYARDGSTIFLTTHYIEEAEQVSDMVFIIDSGRIVDKGRPRDLVERLPGKYVVEYPAERCVEPAIRVGHTCIQFVDSLEGVGPLDHARVSHKRLEHYVLLTVRSWGALEETGEEEGEAWWTK